MAQSTDDEQVFCVYCARSHVKNPRMPIFSDDVPPRVSKEPIDMFGLKLFSPAMAGFNRIAPRRPDQICEIPIQDLIFKYFAPTHKYKQTGRVNRLMVFSSDIALAKEPYLPLWEAAQKYLVFKQFDEVTYKLFKGYNIPSFVLNKEEPDALIAMDYLLRVAEWAFFAAHKVSHYPWNPQPQPKPTLEYKKDGLEEIERPTPIKIEYCTDKIDNSMDNKTVTLKIFCSVFFIVFCF